MIFVIVYDYFLFMFITFALLPIQIIIRFALVLDMLMYILCHLDLIIKVVIQDNLGKLSVIECQQSLLIVVHLLTSFL